MAERGAHLNGVINVYKEKGYTSHDVVAKLRGILRQKKIGHTGTLDPQAEGVLPVCLGTATKLCDMLTDKTKEYQAVMRLGVVTDTQDLTGEVLSEAEVTCSEEEVRQVIMSFLGKSEQIPPMYSALKVNGKKLYELARAGKEVERKPRPIEIFSLEILDISLPEVTFVVNCSKGTYIRTLCHDIGQNLGCGGAMASLLRTRVERFTLDEALKLSEIEQKRDDGTIGDHVVSVETMFDNLPAVTIADSFKKMIDNGNSVEPRMIAKVELARESKEKVKDTAQQVASLQKDGTQMRIYNEAGKFYGIYRYDSTRMMLKPDKMFLEREDT